MNISEYDNDKPIFEHNCNECIFLANIPFREKGYELVDVYYCPVKNQEGDLLIRHGNEIPSYFSTNLVTAMSMHYWNVSIYKVYMEIIKIASEKNIISDELLLKSYKCHLGIKNE